MARPTDWSALGLPADPVPGDGYEVTRLAKQYQDTADEIDRQAAALRRLAGTTGSDWVGEAGKAFHKHATELADKIEKAHHRYATAAEALRGWVTPLEDAQRVADKALADAEHATAAAAASAPLPAAPAGSPPPTAAEQQLTARRATTHTQAGDALRDAHRRAIGAIGDYTDGAGRTAKKIRGAISHDGVHDSTWDKIKGWVHEHAALIKQICKVIGYIVTAIVVIGLVVSMFVPGLNILVGGVALSVLCEAAAAGGTGLLLLGHAAVATTGDGSWLDVGLDVFALATLGAGRVLSTGLETGATAARTLAADTAASRASTLATQNTRLSRAGWSLVSKIPLVGKLVGASGRVAAIDRSVVAAGDAARAAVNAIEASPGVGARVLYGGGDEAANALLPAALAKAVPGVPELDAAAARGTRMGLGRGATTWGGFSVDSANHILEDTTDVKTRLEPYFTHPLVTLP